MDLNVVMDIVVVLADILVLTVETGIVEDFKLFNKFFPNG